jgi:CRP/FNR family transcriptional regulator, cyclic AMP receptor protein
MKIDIVSDTFPLLSTASPQTIEWLLNIATEHDYPSERAVLMEDAWGNAVYFIVSGWVKIRRNQGDESVTIAILGTGDFFGEMAVLDESPRSTDVISLSPVKLLSVSRERFIQILFKDPQLHHRMLQMMVRRVRQINLRLQMRLSPPAVKLAQTLVSLADNYGQKSEPVQQIFNIPFPDLAAVTEITLEETTKIMEKLSEKGWINIDTANNTIYLINYKQLVVLATKL